MLTSTNALCLDRAAQLALTSDVRPWWRTDGAPRFETLGTDHPALSGDDWEEEEEEFFDDDEEDDDEEDDFFEDDEEDDDDDDVEEDFDVED